MLAHFETVKQVKVAIFEVAFAQYRYNLKTIANSTLNNSVQSLKEFDAKEMYLHLKNRFVSL